MRKIAVACSVLFGVLLVASSLGVNGFDFGHPRDRQSVPESDPGTTSRVREAFGTLPLSFVENRGQVDPRVAYYVPGHDTAFYFTREGVTIALTGSTLSRGSGADGLRDVARPVGLPTLPDRPGSPQRWVVKLDFVGANPEVRPLGQDPTPAVISYFKGPREAWKTGLPTYASVVYPNLWPGIDLVYTGTATRLKYTFLVHPGADPDRILLAYRGITAVTLTNGGELDVATPAGGFRDARPYAYQEVEGRRVGVGARYAPGLDAAGAYGYGFRLGPYDRAKLLVLDPAMLLYAGYIGGAGQDFGRGVAVDSAGNAYVTGYTFSTDFPATVGPDTTFNGGTIDAFVAKVNAAGTALLYAGYVGGAGDDYGFGVAVDTAGNAYVTGFTASSEATFPATVGPDLTYNGGYDAFVAKVNAAGTALLYAGYIGGAGQDFGRGVAVDTAGNAYVTGGTGSSEATLPVGFPVTVGPDLTYNGGFDAFVAKVNAAGTGLVYAGYIGGAGDDEGFGIAVDSAGNAYVTGLTRSTEATFPVAVGPDLTSNGGGFDVDAFVAKVNAAGTGLVYAGYIGGAGDDEGFGIAVDSAGNAYVTGLTRSTEATFPVAVGPDLTFNGGDDAFVAKVNAAGTGLVYAGYIGGSDFDVGDGIAVDGLGNAYVTGFTGSSEATFPVAVGPDLTFNGGDDAFVAKVNAAGTVLVYAGYIGGQTTDEGYGIAVDGLGNAYVTGLTYSTEATFPVTIGPDLTYNSAGDAFVAKVMELVVGPPATLTLSPAADTNTIGTTHTVMATVQDAFGNPVPGVIVRFTVTGSVSVSGQCTTDSNGQCSFTYQGPDLPGADVITAFADTNGNGMQDAGEPTGAAAKIWVLPVTTPLCEIIITDGGWIIANNGDKSSFGGNAKSSESGATSGQQQYRDRGPAQPMRVNSINVLAIVCDGATEASIYGQATIDGSGSFFFRIKVKDVAEPGVGQDTYWIILENGYNSGEHTLGGGNVQIHRG